MDCELRAEREISGSSGPWERTQLASDDRRGFGNGALLFWEWPATGAVSDVKIIGHPPPVVLVRVLFLIPVRKPAMHAASTGHSQPRACSIKNRGIG